MIAKWPKKQPTSWTTSWPLNWRITALTLAILGFTADAQTPQGEMRSFLGQLKDVFEVGYAPLQWKAEHLGWDIAQAHQAANSSIGDRTSSNEFQQTLKKFLQGTADYHVTWSFTKSEKSALPIGIRRFGDRYYLVYIDRTKLPLRTFPFSIGDEIVSFDGQPINQALADVIEDGLGSNSSETDLALAETLIFQRHASIGMQVPKGPVLVEFQRGAQRFTHQLYWEYTPETTPEKQNSFLPPLWPEPDSLQHHKKHLFWAPIAGTLSDVFSPYSLAHPIGYLGPIGPKVVWQNSGLWQAYIYQNASGHLVGVIRISSYLAVDYASSVNEFSRIMSRFERLTDALVIDQLNNPGGALFYMYALLSHFSDGSLSTPRHRIALTTADLDYASRLLKLLKDVSDDASARSALGDTWTGFPVDYQMVLRLRGYAHFVLEQWKQEQYLTEPFYISGVDRINRASSGNYTKPILVLTNELDFSGGDFFPAILQDNQRATIMGTRTAGAGGYIVQYKTPNRLGVHSINYTGSLAIRSNGQPIENLGITPDIEYQPTRADLMTGYQGYKAEIQRQVERMINDSSP